MPAKRTGSGLRPPPPSPSAQRPQRGRGGERVREGPLLSSCVIPQSFAAMELDDPFELSSTSAVVPQRFGIRQSNGSWHWSSSRTAPLGFGGRSTALVSTPRGEDLKTLECRRQLAHQVEKALTEPSEMHHQSHCSLVPQSAGPGSGFGSDVAGGLQRGPERLWGSQRGPFSFNSLSLESAKFTQLLTLRISGFSGAKGAQWENAMLPG